MSTSRAEVAEVGERVVHVVRAPREAAVPAEAAGLAVGVREGRDRDDLVVGRGDVARPRSCCSLAAAATTVMPPLYRRQIAWCRTSLLVRPQFRSSLPVFATLMLTASISGQAGIERVALGEDPIEPADVPGQQPVAVGVEDPDRPDAGAGRDADDADRVVDGGDRAGHVRAVAVLVLPRGSIARRAVHAADDVEVRVHGDARVDDGDVRGRPVRRRCRCSRSPTGGRRRARRRSGGLGGDPDDLVGDDGDDARVGPEGLVAGRHRASRRRHGRPDRSGDRP